MTRSFLTVIPLLPVLLLLPGLGAQDPAADQAVRTQCARQLANFARVASRNKVDTRAKQAYEEVLRHYDADDAVARRALGFKKGKDGWEPIGKRNEWLDKANDDKRHKVLKEWADTRMTLAKLHRDFGLETWETERKLAEHHLRRAISFDPFDEAAHVKLGHAKRSFGNDTYYGTEEQLDFIGNMKRIEQKALTLAQKDDYEIKPVDTIPTELALLEKEFHGTQSKNFVIFTRGTQENADNCAKWAERALEFLEYMLGEKRAKDYAVVARQRVFGWRGFIWTKYEREDLIKVNLERNQDSAFVKSIAGARSREAEKLFSNFQWNEGGKSFEIAKKLMPSEMHDRLVNHIWELGIAVHFPRDPDGPANESLMEGALHAASWYLLSTAMSRRGSLPTGTVAEPEVALPDGINWWLREMRDQAIAHTDMPVKEMARQRLEDYPNDARLKAWSFMTWLMARYPDKWHQFTIEVPGDKVPFPEEVEKAAEILFERKLDDMEDEWREWASGRGVTAAATGYGPPLLPEVPNPEQVAGVQRLNELRAEAGLPTCELDLEATLACVEHARYLLKHPEHWKWPEAHEQNPAKEGFTPRGMRCGLRSVIVIHATEAAGSVDSWFGTVYHRFPLLAENIRRIGFAFEGDMCVLDMGSLAEPHAVDAEGKPTAKKWVIWPPDGATNVDRQFAFYELPNPLSEVPAPNNRDDEAGYPASLTMSHFIHPQVVDCDMRLYEVKKRGKEWARQGEVKCHLHTPMKPLLSRNEVVDTVFVIPYAPLEKRTTYQAVVNLKLEVATESIKWTFTTGAMGLQKGSK